MELNDLIPLNYTYIDGERKDSKKRRVSKGKFVYPHLGKEDHGFLEMLYSILGSDFEFKISGIYKNGLERYLVLKGSKGEGVFKAKRFRLFEE
jgi:hypothetical protein